MAVADPAQHRRWPPLAPNGAIRERYGVAAACVAGAGAQWCFSSCMAESTELGREAVVRTRKKKGGRYGKRRWPMKGRTGLLLLLLLPLLLLQLLWALAIEQSPSANARRR